MRRSGRLFSRHEGGNTAALFGIAIVPLLGVVGAGVDYASTLRVKTMLQNAVDAAALAGAADQGRGGTTASTNTVVANFVASKFTSPDGSTPTVTTTVSASGTVAVSATLSFSTSFLKIVGISSFPLKVESEAVFGAGTAEVAIVLDITGSMSGAKLAAAQSAASGLVDALYASPGAASRVKIGLVPFNYYVNVGATYKNATWMTGTADQTGGWPAGCDATATADAIYGTPVTKSATGYNDGVPFTYTYQEWPIIGYGTPYVHCWSAYSWTTAWDGVVGSRNYPSDFQADASSGNPIPAIFGVGDKPPELTRLTASAATVKNAIAALTATGETYIPSGLLWGWRLLSPTAPFADGAPYGSGVKKILILMTDGANTISPTYPAHTGNNVTDANNITAQTCANIKATGGIEVYTIAFDVTDPTIQGVLANCASSASNYFNATTIAAMQTAFTQIGAALTAIRVSK